MVRKKMRPHVLREGPTKKPDSFLYRLLSDQRFLAVLALALLLIIVIPLLKTYSQSRLINKEIAEEEKKIAEFTRQHQELEEMISYLKSEQSIEERARLSQNKKKPGERVIVITDLSEVNKINEKPQNDEESSNLKEWWNYFFKQ